MKRMSYYNQVIKLLQELHKSYPSYNMGRHLSTALDGYGDVWGLTDAELFFALEKYKTQLDMDVPHMDSEEEIDEIMRDAADLQNILNQEDNGEDY